MRLGRSTAAVVAAVGIASVAGLVRDVTIAHFFGTSAESDIFFFAFSMVVRLPQFLLPAVSAAFIPIYLRLKAKGSGEALPLVGTVVNMVLIGMAGLTLITAIFAPVLTTLTGSGFSDGLRIEAVVMLRLLSPTIVFLGSVGILKAILESEGRFLISQSQQLIMSLGMILAVLFLGPRLGIYSLPVGIMAANGIQVFWMIYWARRAGLLIRPRWQIRHPEIRKFVTLLLPGLAGAAVLWMMPVIDVALASGLTEGSVAALAFANRPLDLFSRVAIHSLVITGLPILTMRAMSEGRPNMGQAFAGYLGNVVYVLAPISLVLFALRVPMIRILFERGEFNPESTAATASVFGALALGLPMMAVATLVSTSFNALEDTRTPAIWGAGANVVVKAMTAPLLTAKFGLIGLAASTSIVYAASTTILLWRFGRTHPSVDVGVLVSGLLRVLGLALVGSLPAFLIAESGIPDISAIATATLATAAAYLAATRIVRVPESEEVQRFLSQEWKRIVSKMK